MTRRQIFCLPGLGLSSEIFEHLKFDGEEVILLNWIEPKGWESIEDYARRLSDSMSTVNGEIILIGHSFGGVLAQEIASIRSVEQVILISSMMKHAEIPGRLKLLGKYGLYRLISKSMILWTFPFWARTHSYRTPELRRLFRASVSRLSSHYFRWALFQISTWKGVLDLDTPIFRIHGNKDVTFKIQKIDQVDQLVEGGDHNMVYLRGDEISQMIVQVLAD